MRIYEFAKEVGISAKDVLKILQQEGFEAKSHMSILADPEKNLLERILATRSKTPVNSIVDHKKSEKNIVAEIKEVPVKQEIRVAPKANSVDGAREQKGTNKTVQPDIPQGQRSVILRQMTVSELASEVAVQVSEIILLLLRWGIVAPKNQALSEALVARVAQHYNIEPAKHVSSPEKLQQQPVSLLSQSDHINLKERMPIVTILGHVDHGKTTLLDFIRKTRVAAREKGGITQHLGAYEAHTPRGNIVFLDTPGHEAFSRIRQRGIRVADIVVLIVAADDGVMPQTVESIKRAKSMNVPIIVAINKVDKVESRRLDVVKRELSQHDLLVEDWGGQVVCVPISAKTGQGVDTLLDMIVLQSQLMELRADTEGYARGYVLESRLEKGRGPVATLISQHGILKMGDYLVSSSTGGRVSSIVDSVGVRLSSAIPAVPVQVAGFDKLPEAGDYFQVVSRDEYRAAMQKIQSTTAISTEKTYTEGALNIVIKTDTDSSKEALLESISKLGQKAVSGFNILHAAIGNISESDVELAYNTGAILVGLHIKIEANAMALAQRKHVEVLLFDIIYKLLEDLEERDARTKKVTLVRTKIGEAEVIRVFDIKNIGIIAGAQVKDGRITREGILVIYRGGKKIGEGKLRSLQREKRAVKEVHGGYECGFMLEKYDDWAIGDRVECYVEEPKK